jgi:DNA polymerase V
MLGTSFSQGVAQLNLFDENAPRAGSERLMEVLDHLNAKDGKERSTLPGRAYSSSGR